jgi:hypothetical protein
MPDERRHRGAHPEDGELFGEGWHGRLREAVSDYSWLLSRGYAPVSGLKVVGDRFGLSARQRTAVMRSACSDLQRDGRKRKEVGREGVRGKEMLIDGYNVLTTVEAALAGGVVIVGREGCWRDMASMHGTWRRVEETWPAVERVGEMLAELGVARARWFLDSPVSNSGRLKGVIEEIARGRGWDWVVEVVMDPDKVLVAAREGIVATADSVVLDGCGGWFNLAREVVKGTEGVWVVEMSEGEPSW